MDDLWHFFLLLSIILVGFIALGSAQFGSHRVEFSTPSKGFETVWEMLLGSMPASGLIPSTYWTHDKLMLIYLLLYNFLCFMFMLNFIIAIICESYLDVTAIVKSSDADQEFFTDVASVTKMAIKSLIFRWPGHMSVIHELSVLKRKRVSYRQMRVLFPDILPVTIGTFMKHYAAFEPIRRRSGAEHSDIKDATHEIVSQLSVMLRVPVPSVQEHLAESKNLQKMGYQGHVYESKRSNALLTANNVGPQLERTISLLTSLMEGGDMALADEHLQKMQLQRTPPEKQSLPPLPSTNPNINPVHTMAGGGAAKSGRAKGGTMQKMPGDANNANGGNGSGNHDGVPLFRKGVSSESEMLHEIECAVDRTGDVSSYPRADFVFPSHLSWL